MPTIADVRRRRSNVGIALQQGEEKGLGVQSESGSVAHMLQRFPGEFEPRRLRVCDGQPSLHESAMTRIERYTGAIGYENGNTRRW